VKVAQCAEIYIQKKQDCGYSYASIAKVIRRFARFTGRLNICLVSGEHLRRFLSRSPISNNTWRSYAWHLRNFFIYWRGHGLIDKVPTVEMKPEIDSKFVPYVYTRREIRRLLDASNISQRGKCVINSETLKTLILFLYGTGIKIGDVLALSDKDISLTLRTIVIRSSTVQARTIPIGRDVKKLLKRHLNSNERRGFGFGQPLFLTVKGTAIDYSRICQTFNRLRRVAEVRRSDSSYQPRIHDLRHSFAVHSIAKWTEAGFDLDRVLPILATYLGNCDMHGVERYLELSPCSYQGTLNRL
jgi:integrase/recombinase XerD